MDQYSKEHLKLFIANYFLETYFQIDLLAETIKIWNVSHCARRSLLKWPVLVSHLVNSLRGEHPPDDDCRFQSNHCPTRPPDAKHFPNWTNQKSDLCCRLLSQDVPVNCDFKLEKTRCYKAIKRKYQYSRGINLLSLFLAESMSCSVPRSWFRESKPPIKLMMQTHSSWNNFGLNATKKIRECSTYGFVCINFNAITWK